MLLYVIEMAFIYIIELSLSNVWGYLLRKEWNRYFQRCFCCNELV